MDSIATQRKNLIPVIDISSPTQYVAKELLSAASKYGFVFVANNDAGISPQDIDSMFQLSREFFNAPEEVKEQASINSNKSGKNTGWLRMHTETLDPGKQKKGDFKEAFNVGEFVSGHAVQPLPGPLATKEEQIGRFAHDCHELCKRILELFAIGLDIPAEDGGKDWFTQRHDRSKGSSGSIFRMLYYPAPTPGAPVSDSDVRAGAHSDYGSVTLLFQEPASVPGLEILLPDNTWAAVPSNPNNSPNPPILVNIGDLMDFWSNGVLKSTVHRVSFPTDGSETRERYSIAYFCHPLDEARLIPIPSAVVEARETKEGRANKLRGDAMTARDHLNNRLAATYGIKKN